MKVSAILVSSLLSWVVAYPGLLDWQKDTDKLMGYLLANEVNGGAEGNQRHAKRYIEGEPQGLIETIRLWWNQFIPFNFFNNEKSNDGGIFGILHGRNNEKDEAFLLPMNLLFGKDNIFNSIISNAAAIAGMVIDRVKSNFLKGNGFPFLPFGKELTGLVRSFDKSDFDHSKGYESRGDDNFQVPPEVEGADTRMGKEGHAGGYQGSVGGGAGGVASEKHAIHSASSQGSSKGDAKTAATVKTAPGDSGPPTELVEKSADVKKVGPPSGGIDQTLLSSLRLTTNIKGTTGVRREVNRLHDSQAADGIKKIDGDAEKNDWVSSKDKEDSDASKEANGKERAEKISGGVQASKNADKKVDGSKTKEARSDVGNDERGGHLSRKIDKNPALSQETLED